MIQRIQTVYLLVGAAALIGLLFVDALWASGVAERQAWFPPAVFVLGGLAVVVAVIAVFLYKQRERQRTVVVAAQVLTVLLMGALYGGLYLADVLYVRTAEGWEAGLLVGLFLPILAYACFTLARRGITRDINLLRSVDRLR